MEVRLSAHRRTLHERKDLERLGREVLATQEQITLLCSQTLRGSTRPRSTFEPPKAFWERMNGRLVTRRGLFRDAKAALQEKLSDTKRNLGLF